MLKWIRATIGIRRPNRNAPEKNLDSHHHANNPSTFNVYCDESCYLEHDSSNVMVLGAIWSPLGETRKTAQDIRAIKERHSLPPYLEIKWTKVSPAKLDFYRELVDYFFNNDALQLRVLIVPDKSRLRHEDFDQNHDDWYHKMYYYLLEPIVNPENAYRIYVDVKDTWSTTRFRDVRDALRRRFHDPSGQIIERLQVVQSQDVEQSQLTDLLIGAIAYANRGLTSSTAKLALVRHMQQRSELTLKWSTARARRKVNVFVWKPWELNGVR